MLGPAFMRQRLRRPQQRHDERDGGRRVRLPVGVVVVLANAMACVVRYLSAKLGVVTARRCLT